MKAAFPLLGLSLCALLACAGGGRPATAPALPAPASMAGAGGRFLNPIFDGVDIVKDLVYARKVDGLGKVQDLVLDLYQPSGDSAERRPLVVWCHGGALSAGVKEEMAELATGLARRGYVCLSVNYRLAPDPASVSYRSMDNAVEDIYSVADWAGANAARYRLDPDRLALGGGSAGAMLALNAIWEEGRWRPKARGSIFFAGVIIAGSQPRQTERYTKTPLLLVNGDQDEFMPASLARDLAERLKLRAVPHELLVLAGEGHSISARSADEELLHILRFLYRSLAGPSPRAEVQTRSLVQGESFSPDWKSPAPYHVLPPGWQDGAEIQVPLRGDDRALFLADTRELSILPIRILPPLELDLALNPSQPGSLLCRITNRSTTRSQGGRISIADGGGGRELAFSGLAPGDTRDFVVPAALGRATYSIDLDSGWRASIRKDLRLATIPRLRQAPRLDGELSDWPEGRQFVLDSASQLNQIRDWSGTSDLSAGISLGWDEERLYLGVEVEDDVHFQEALGWGMWAGDGIQFAVDTRARPESTGNGYSEIGLSLSSTNRLAQVWRWIAPLGQAEGPLPPGLTAIRRAGGKTVYEAALPWALLGAEQVERGQVIRASLLVNDNDGAGRRGWIEWGKGIGDSKDSAAFNLIQLGD